MVSTISTGSWKPGVSASIRDCFQAGHTIASEMFAIAEEATEEIRTAHANGVPHGQKERRHRHF